MKSDKPTFLQEVISDWRELTRPQKWLYFLYALLLVLNTLDILRAIEVRIGLSFLAPISDVIFIIMAIMGSITIFLKKIRVVDIIFLLAIVMLYFVSAYFNFETSSFSAENSQRFFRKCLPMFLVGLTMDRNTSIPLFVIIAYWALFLQIIFLMVFSLGVDVEGNERNEAMGESYALLPFTCLLIYNAFKRGGIFHWIIAVIAIFVSLSLGTRGPIICIVFFVAVYFIAFKHYKYNVLTKILIGMVAFIIYSYSKEIAMSLSVISEHFGLSTRVFESIVEDEMTNIEESSYRDVIWGRLIDALREKRILFDLNLYADRLYNGIHTKWYAHNLELEFLCDFGLIGGSILIVLLFLYVIRAFRSVWYDEAVVLLLVFFTSSIMALQFSGSYLMFPVFWFFMGMCTTMIRERKKRDSNTPIIEHHNNKQYLLVS